MAKGKAKFSNEAVAAPQPRSLRSRKMECPRDELSLTVDSEAPHHHQDSEGHNTTVVSTHIQSLESLVQECTNIAYPLPQVAEQPSTDEKLTENTMKASEELEENSATCPNHDSQLPGCIINLDIRTNKDGKKEINPEEVTRLVFDTHTDNHQVLISEDGDGSCADDLQKQLGAKKTSHCNLERCHESSQEEPSRTKGEFKEVAKESALGLPVRKKRRMGICGLTKKERSHFLQIKKREIGHKGVERAEKQLCVNIVKFVAQEIVISPDPSLSSPLSIPVDSATVQSKAETTPKSSHCGIARPETRVTLLDGTSTLWHLGCSEGKTSEAEESTVTDPEQTVELKSHQPTEKTTGGHSVSLKHQEQEETVSEEPVKQREDGDGAAVCFNNNPFTADYTETSQNKTTEKMNNGSETDTLQACVTEKTDEMMDDRVKGGAASIDRDCVETPDTPSESEKKDNCAPDVEFAAASSTVNTEHNATGDAAELIESQYFDYVSDSQLNSIALIEEKMEKEVDPGFSYCPKDATNLVRGLIRELSSLNQKVMATHRELVNLRRGSKASRSSTR